MIIYISEDTVTNYKQCEIPNEVLRYIVSKAEKYSSRCGQLYSRYIGMPQIEIDTDNSDSVRAEANYAKYIVDITKGYYLSEPVKYDNNDKKDDTADINMVSSVEAKIDKSTGKLIRNDVKSIISMREIDISPIIDCYNVQGISKLDDKNGKNIGIYGESAELLYASTDTIPYPRSAVYSPENIVLVQDDTIEHRDLFAIWYEKRETLNENKYYAVSVYSASGRVDYKSDNISVEKYSYHKVSDFIPHSFGEVPVIIYENNEERQGDFEQVINLIDARNSLLSDRLTDKKRFVNAVLALYGAVFGEGVIEDMKETKIIDGLPVDSKLEYIQKTFDESSLKILDDTLVSEIHKMTLTPDMTDEKFAGNTSGVALKLKLLALNILVKNKMIAIEEGLKKRWRLYNNWLKAASKIPEMISINDVDIVFTLCLPIDESAVVNMVCQLKSSGLVDDQTLLSLLWFIKDPAEALKNMHQQKKENQKEYLDSFANRDNDNEDTDK